MAWVKLISAILLLQYGGSDAQHTLASNNPFTCRFMFTDILCAQKGVTQQSLPSVGRHWKNLGSPETSLTGPQSIYATSDISDIMYGNYDSPADGLGKKGDQEALITPEITTSGPACVSFAYYMYGPDVGSLFTVIRYGNTNPEYGSFVNITKSSPRKTAAVFEKMIAEGNLGKQWISKKFQVATSGQTKFQVAFQVMRGNGRLGNIGIDDIRITKDLTNCPNEDSVTPVACSSNPCNVNANCVDLSGGGHQCSCKAGFSGNGVTCTNINECLSSTTNNCHTQATCTDTIGSYTCACNTGYSGNGFSCTDINECANNPCHSDATCSNIAGSFVCNCNSGFAGNGFSCVRSLITGLKSCDAVFDIVFLLDASETAKDLFAAEKAFIKKVAKTYLENQSVSRASVVAYSVDPVQKTHLFTYTNMANFFNEVDLVPFIGGEAKLDGPLGTLLSQFVTSNRPSLTTYRLGIVLNTAKTSGLGSTQNNLGNSIRALGYNLVTVGVGPNVDRNELLGIAGGNSTMVIQVANGDDLLLDSTTNMIQGLSCPVVNECLKNPCHVNANCRDTEKSFECSCKPGYTGDGALTCNDINECLSSTTNNCHSQATCLNTPGSYQCVCNAGYSGNGFTCTDINECLSSTTDNCHSQATCLNTPGSYQCVCNTGYSGNGFTCTDINECLSSTTNNCHSQATCLNTPGSYRCACNTGYTGDGFTCTDINECLSSTTNNCHSQASCVNTPGSYQCTCNTGYTGNGFTCADINECLSSTTNNCHSQATCTNIPGSYRCTCNSGYTGDGFTCTDINECLNNPCSTDATCTNTPGSFRCACKDGFIGDGKICTRSDASCGNVVDLVFLLDASDHGKDNFDDQKGLIKTIASTFLAIQPKSRAAVIAYAFDPVQEIKLVDYTTFSAFSNQVDQINLIGGKARMDGSLGTVLSEFAVSPRPGVTQAQIAFLFNAGKTEGQEATQNSIGSSMRALGYKLVILGIGNTVDPNELYGIAGETKDNKVFLATTTSELIARGDIKKINDQACPEINECLTNPCHTQATCTDTKESFTCTCNVGYAGDGRAQCDDVNECSSNPCSPFATCSNIPGSYVCVCKTGYTGNGLTCTNINECLSNPCHSQATCTDTQGSFTCACNTGYSGNGFQCTNINECLSNPCHTQATCTDTPGSFTCACNTGYTGNGFQCTNINECLNNPCHTQATCTDTQGSFTCACNAGYSGNGFQCTNINECLNNPCHTQATCTDNPGSFTCVCNTGYAGDGRVCTDINECLSNPCSTDATCKNTPGSFGCHCNTGFRGDGRTCTPATVFCNYDIDLVFVLDSSRHALSVFQREVELVISIASAFLTRPNSRASVVTYADDPVQAVKLADYTTMAAFNQAVHGIKHIGGNARMDRALGTALSEFTTNPRQVTQIAVLMAAGPSDGQRSTQNNLGVSMRALGYKLFVAGVTQNVDTQQLQEIAGGNNTYLILPTSIESLFGDTIIKRMVNEACPEVNECLNNPCSPNGLCTNTIKSFTCACKPGFTGDGFTCVDINECLNKPCHQFAACTNTIGSFQCKCNAGFVGDGLNTCTDINECLQKPCHENADCTNTIGSYKCKCKIGYEGNGTFCMEMRYRDWGAWTTCTVTCGGTMKRTRQCSVSKIDYPHACPGPADEVRPCNNKCHIEKCPDHNTGQFYTFEDDKANLLHGINKTWVVAKKTPTIYTGPDDDHTFASGCGHFIFFEASKCPSDTFGFLETPPELPKSQQYCIKFSMMMYSNKFPEQMGSLTLYLFQYQQTTKQVFHHDGISTNNRSQWIPVEVDLFLTNSTMPFGVQFMAEQGKSIHSDVAIDDIAFTPGLCTGPVNGNWGAWSSYGACNVSCGSGKQIKTRLCNSPAPRNGGKDCVGESQWSKPCELSACRVNGLWTEWQEWSACSILCDKGQRYRLRECYNIKANRDTIVQCTKVDGTLGKEEEQWMNCSRATCKPDGTLYDWSKWSDCSVTCDYGIKYRTGKCSVVDGCNGVLSQSAACAIRACYVNRQYGPWQDWGACSTSCGNGMQMRKRYCPLVMGCMGNATESRKCENVKCHMPTCPSYPLRSDVYNFENTKKVIHTAIPSWKMGTGETRSLKVGPNHDVTWQNMAKPECGHYMYYEASRKPAGDTGLISTQLRTPIRLDNCISFYLNMYTMFPKEMGNLSVSVHQRGLKLSTLFHHMGVMKPNTNTWTNLNLDINLKDLSPFSVIFKAQRGIGYNSDISVDDIVLYDGLCTGPVNGEWGQWSGYSTCTKSCGGGSQMRSRQCSVRNGGKECEGDQTTTRACNEQLCPVNGSWCEWSLWNECSKTCGGGSRSRVRECTNPIPVAPGVPCMMRNGVRGSSEEEQGSCNSQICDVNGNWGQWQEGNCVNANKRRVRQCNNPAARGNGKLCAVPAVVGDLTITHRLSFQTEDVAC